MARPKVNAGFFVFCKMYVYSVLGLGPHRGKVSFALPVGMELTKLLLDMKMHIVCGMLPSD